LTATHKLSIIQHIVLQPLML